MTPDQEFRILIVEDHPVTASVLKTSLELLNRDYVIDEVPSGEEAMLEVNLKSFDLLVTNDHLPGVQGPDLVKRLRARHAELKAILLTDGDVEKRKAETEDLKLKAVLPKPIDADQFVEAVNRALHGLEDMEDVVIVVEDKLGPLPHFDQAPVEAILPRLHSDLGAIAVAFVTRTGKVRVKSGTFDDGLHFGELSVLLANNFTTTAEIATVLGGAETPAIHYHSGDSYDIYALSCGEHYFLSIIFPGGSQRQMGAVLRTGVKASQQIVGHIHEAKPEGKAEPGTVESEGKEDTGKTPAEARKPKEKAEPKAEKKADKPEKAKAGKKAGTAKDDGPLDMSEFVQYEPLGGDAQLDLGGGDVDKIELDDSALDDLNLDDLDLDDLGSFWEEAAEDIDKVRSGALSMEEAKELGLIEEE